MTEYTQLTDIFANKFIARPDRKAVQYGHGIWTPHREPKLADGSPGADIGWTREALEQHLAGQATYGHYLLSSDSNAKLFVLDIDLINSGLGYYYIEPDLAQAPSDINEMERWYEANRRRSPDLNPRNLWKTRFPEARPWLKLQFRTIVELFTSAIHSELGIPCAAAYSGNKGVHVYGFTGLMPADDIRLAAKAVIDSTGLFGQSQGNNFYIDKTRLHFPNFEIEVFPKQSEIDPNKYGNLVALPLGRNLKSPEDPKFFIDQRLPHNQLAPHPDPVGLLNSDMPWR